MNETDPYFEDALGEIGAFTEDLYAEADPQSWQPSDAGETAPMFQALSQIRERYEVGELIGRGGMKEVYQVYDLRAARHVAMAKPGKALERDDFDTFLREAHITARLDHPGIVKLFDMGIGDDGRPFFTMELKRGRSLRGLIGSVREGHDFPLQRRLHLLLRIFEAIAYAHSRRVLHLDLKPENIQIGEYGEVQVCDWGMGVVIQKGEGDVNQSEVLLDPDLYGPLLMNSRGTPGYMAPEQLRPRQPKVPGMDVYGLGCMLEELITLEAPTEEVRADLIPDVALRSIVSKSKHASPAVRYPTVEAFHQDLSRYLAGYSTSVENAGFFREVTLFYRRHRVPCHLAAGLILLIAALTTAFILQLRASRDRARDAQLVAERAQARYLSEKIRAETMLSNYLAEVGESNRRLRQQADQVVGSTSRLMHSPHLADEMLPHTLLEMMRELNGVVALNPPPDSPAWHQKFWLLFISQDFEGALAFRDKDLGNVSDLVPIAGKYAGVAEGERFLSAADFGNLLQELAGAEGPHGSRIPLIERMLVYDLQFPRPAMDRVSIVADALAAVNPECHDLKLDYDPQREALDIRGSELRFLSQPGGIVDSGLSYLRIIDPLILSIRGTRVRDLTELSGLQLLELDIRESPITDLQPLQDMRSLRRLRISPGQLTAEQLESLPPWVEVVRS